MVEVEEQWLFICGVHADDAVKNVVLLNYLVQLVKARNLILD